MVKVLVASRFTINVTAARAHARYSIAHVDFLAAATGRLTLPPVWGIPG
jgi:hypothetical protein